MDPDENRMLAESMLNLLVKLVDAYVKKQDEAPAQVLINFRDDWCGDDMLVHAVWSDVTKGRQNGGSCSSVSTTWTGKRVPYVCPYYNLQHRWIICF